MFIFLHVQILWMTEIDGTAEARMSKTLHFPKAWTPEHWSECYMLSGHKMVLCTQQKIQGPPVSKLGKKKPSNLNKFISKGNSQSQYLPLPTAFAEFLPGKVWYASGLPEKWCPNYGSLIKPAPLLVKYECLSEGQKGCTLEEMVLACGFPDNTLSLVLADFKNRCLLFLLN